jgi:geranylgeranyl diphosphate synthase type I
MPLDMGSTSNIEAYILSCKRLLEPYIDGYLSQLVEKHRCSCPKLAELYEVFRKAGKGGKYVRGSLVKLGHEIALNRSVGEEILPVCAAFEIFQTAILGHDDVIDKSPLRRGKDSLWRALSRDRDSDGLHYGISQAICLGDVGISLANRLIADSTFDPAMKSEALKVFLDSQLNTMDGEMLDVLMSHEKDYGDERSILQIAALKTAWYTIRGPLQLGAMLGGASSRLLDAMGKYGMALGIAFQLRDDILGIEAEESETGKSNTSDIAEGKVTLLAHFAMKKATSKQRQQLRQIYGNESVSETDRLTIRDIFKRTGAFEKVARRAESYLDEARAKVNEITSEAGTAALLDQLADMMVKRRS